MTILTRKRLTVQAKDLRDGDRIEAVGASREVGGVQSPHRSSGTCHILNSDGQYWASAFGGEDPDEFNITRDRDPHVYIELRDVQIGMILLLDPDEPAGLDYGPETEFQPFRVYGFRRVPKERGGYDIEVDATPLHRDECPHNVSILDFPTMPVRVLTRGGMEAIMEAQRAGGFA